MTRTVAFDIRGSYGHFRKPYAPVSPVTFPFPPPTAVAGMVGAICGIHKDKLADTLGWRNFRVGVRLLRPVSLYRAGINLLNTKRPNTDAYFRPASESCRMQVPYEMLRDPAFRVYVANAPTEIMDELATRLRQGRTAYTVTLGLANCLATVAPTGDGEASEAGTGLQDVGSVVPLGEGVEVDFPHTRPVQRLRVPAEMDGQRAVHRYQEVVVATDGGPLSCVGAPVLRLGDDVFCFI